MTCELRLKWWEAFQAEGPSLVSWENSEGPERPSVPGKREEFGCSCEDNREPLNTPTHTHTQILILRISVPLPTLASSRSHLQCKLLQRRLSQTPRISRFPLILFHTCSPNSSFVHTNNSIITKPWSCLVPGAPRRQESVFSALPYIPGTWKGACHLIDVPETPVGWKAML